MTPRPTFSDLLATPGSSDDAPAQPSPVAGGSVMLNDSAKQVIMTDPRQQARIRKEASINALKGFAQQMAGATIGQ